MFGATESELNVLGDVRDLDIIELGCGTAYFSAWLAKRGARVVGVDPTPAQLETARRMQKETGIEFPLVEAIGEDVPFDDASFDLVHSEYGASIWADPYLWIPEACTPPAPGRTPDLPAQRDAADSLHGDGGREGAVTAPAARLAPRRVGGHAARSSSISRTARCSICCARTASCSSG